MTDHLYMTTNRIPADFIQLYGLLVRLTLGLCSDHELSFVEAGGIIRTLANGNRVALVAKPEGRKGFDAFPILCGELVRDYSEDGPIEVRCGLRCEGEAYACPGHFEEIESYRSLREDERYEMERREESAWI